MTDTPQAVDPLVWLRLVRDHDPAFRQPPQNARMLALWALLLRVTDTGHATVRELAADAGIGEQAVSMAVAWATTTGFLQRVRLANGSVSSSEWLITVPEQYAGPTNYLRSDIDHPEPLTDGLAPGAARYGRY